ncbi:hypothetical protein L2E82_48624 [Cichorium intybus]|uniref:Uncharacterized protein n=1 Tax=Cichorium intybus TaxID=13427 RepID=A0ACB8YZL1_CICIN|nr:hypothetical protein L2E82_48624 [Cichorium intybus]
MVTCMISSSLEDKGFEPFVIRGIIQNGQQQVTFNADAIGDALKLPHHSMYSTFLEEKACRKTLPRLEYNVLLQGPRRNLVPRQCFPPTWKLLTCVISKCLAYKKGNQGQLSLFVMQIVYAMVVNIRLEFASMIVGVFVPLTTKEKRQSIIHFPRFL